MAARFWLPAAEDGDDMPPFSRTYQNFSSGELSPGAIARSDRDFYETGLKDAENVLPLTAGGFTARAGFRHVGQVRGQLSAIDLSGATITAGDAGGSAPSAPDPGNDDPWIIIPGGQIP